MRCKVDHRALAIAGYVEPWTGGAGLRSLSLSTDRPIDAVRLRRLDRDDMPEVDWPIRQVAEPRHQSFARGAWAAIDGFEHLGGIVTLSFELLLTRNSGRRVLLEAGSFRLVVENEQLLLVTDGVEMWLTGLPAQQWLEVTVDWPGGELSADGLDPFRPFYISAPFAAPVPTAIVFCSDIGETLPTLNCRLGRISLVGPTGTADWAFPTLFTTAPLSSTGTALVLHGNPTFCVTSPRWDGTALDARLAPSHYDAVHFHDTDMAGLDWPATHEVTVPDGAPSGVYAVELHSGSTVERIPFFVAPARPVADIAFVVPTSTYLAYADEYLPPHLYEWVGTDRGHEFARDNELRSLYDYHSDGSGVSLVSTRKPKATLRDDYRYPLCGDPHNLPVDLHFLKFCARNDIAVDVLTDADLHAGGGALPGGYRAVTTGSHPEYLSVQMEQAYREYVASGGRLAYLGGNGFAAAVAYRDDLMELRRGPTQSGRTWDGPLAEMGLALTGEPGGYLRDRGRGEYRLVGVGISLMGFSPALPYERTEAGRDASFAWLFEGVGDRFGDTGIVQGGAAGYEVDAVNFHLGSPPDITVLATATRFPDSYIDDPGKWFEGGAEERQAYRRADMTFWRHPRGGMIFCASSVSFLGALPDRGADNDVGRLTLNLLRAFRSLDFGGDAQLHRRPATHQSGELPMKFAATLAFAIGLGLASSAQAETIKIGLQPWLGYGPLWVAEKQGYFAANGVDVELVNFGWDADLAVALASGNIQVTSIATNGVILQRNNGIDLKAFMLMDGSTTADAVLSNKTVNSITELKGKKVAYEVGATSDLLINYALKVNGMTLSDIEAVPINASDAGLALIAGRVDVAVTYEPYISAALSQGPDFKILFSAGEKPGLISDVLAAPADFVAANTTQLQGIIKAWDQAVTYLRENPEEGGKIIADAVGSPMEEFKTAFAGVQLFDIKENQAELAGPFQATVGEIGALMQEAKPDEIKIVPTGDEILDLTALNGLK